MTPRLTIVIPTHARPELILRAIDSVLAQTVPVKLVVSDDGDDEDSAKTAAVLAEKYELALLTGHIEHVRTTGHGAWQNWRAGMEHAIDAGAELVSWLQDDDVIMPHYADRVTRAFDAHPLANVWEGRCQVSPDGEFFLWYSGNGPFIPMKMGPAASFAEGSILASTSYFTSHSLAPGFAFRNVPHLRVALAAVPDECDIFVERLMPALAANGGPFIADPIVAGYWIQHPGQLSNQQHPDQPRQTGLLVDALDAMMPTLVGWQESLAAWLHVIPAGQIVSWLGQIDVTRRESGRKSEWLAEVRRVMAESLTGRVEIESRYAIAMDSYWSDLIPQDPHLRHLDEIRVRITNPLKQIRHPQAMAG